MSEENVWKFGEMLCAVSVETIQYKVLNCDPEKMTKFHLRRVQIVLFSIFHLQTTDSDFGH